MVVDFEFRASELKPLYGLNNRLMIKQLKARFDEREMTRANPSQRVRRKCKFVH